MLDYSHQYDSIKKYMPKEEEDALILRWQEHRNLEDRNTLILNNIFYIIHMATSIKKRKGPSGCVTVGDLTGVGIISMMRALNSYNPAKTKAKFGSFFYSIGILDMAAYVAKHNYIVRYPSPKAVPKDLSFIKNIDTHYIETDMEGVPMEMHDFDSSIQQEDLSVLMDKWLSMIGLRNQEEVLRDYFGIGRPKLLMRDIAINRHMIPATVSHQVYKGLEKLKKIISSDYYSKKAANPEWFSVMDDYLEL